jgi:hypothetical protein
VAGSLVANGGIVLAWNPAVAPDTAQPAPLTLHAYGCLLVWPIAVLAPVVPLAFLGADDHKDLDPEGAFPGPIPSRPHPGWPARPGTGAGDHDVHRRLGPPAGNGPSVV